MITAHSRVTSVEKTYLFKKSIVPVLALPRLNRILECSFAQINSTSKMIERVNVCSCSMLRYVIFRFMSSGGLRLIRSVIPRPGFFFQHQTPHHDALPVCPAPRIATLRYKRDFTKESLFFEHLNYLVPSDAAQSDVLGSFF